MEKPADSVRMTDQKCPKCGSRLLTDGDIKWCSFVGGSGVKPCMYGIKEEPKDDENTICKAQRKCTETREALVQIRRQVDRMIYEVDKEIGMWIYREWEEGLSEQQGAWL